MICGALFWIYPPPIFSDKTRPMIQQIRISEKARHCGGIDEDTVNDVSNSSISGEITGYLADKVSPGTNALHYWEVNHEKFPHLAALAQKHLCIPASSGPVERLFSVAGKIFRPDRCVLKDKTFQELIFIKGNAKFN